MGKVFPFGLAGLGCAVILIAGCQLPGASGSGSAGQSAPSARASTASSANAGLSGEAASKAVCAMFTKADAEAVAGRPINDSPTPDVASDRSGTLSMGASCMYTLPNQTIMSNEVPGLPAVYVAVDTKDVDRVWGNKELYIGRSPEAVPGLGDEAYFAQPLAGKNSGTLFVRKGSHYIYIEQELLGEGPADEKQKEIDLARVILGKI